MNELFIVLSLFTISGWAVALLNFHLYRKQFKRTTQADKLAEAWREAAESWEATADSAEKVIALQQQHIQILQP